MADIDTTPATSAEEMAKVIERVQKLLSKTKDGAGTTEAEAATALNLAQKLLSKYNLDMAVVEAAGASKTSGVVERVKETVKGRAMYKWQQQLAKYVAEANFCYHLIKVDSEWIPGHDDDEKGWVSGRRKKTPTHIFIGRKANVITAQLMYAYLTQTIEDMVMVAMKLDNSQRLSRSAMSWKEGCADRLCERLATKRQDLITEHDAKVRAEEARIRTAAAEAAKKAEAAKQNVLPANEQAEVRAEVAGMAAQARDRTGYEPSEPDISDRPEVNAGDTWTPPAADVAEAPKSTGLVLASVYDDAEREANYEVAQGLEPGTLAKWRAERAQREQERAEAAAKAEAKGEMDRVEAPVKAETERQRAAREKREREEDAKNRRRWAREDERDARRADAAHAKRDHTAYHAGASAGKHIGLDTQVGAKTDAKQLKGK